MNAFAPHLGKYDIIGSNSPPFHWHATGIQGREDLGEDIWKRYFKFVFVRNPWDRLVSYYHFVKPDKQLTYIGLMPTIHSSGTTWDKGDCIGFDDWIKTVTSQDDPMLSQLNFITDREGVFLVDFVGKFESLKKDWRIICEKIGIQAKLPHSNKTVRRHHYNFFYTEETKQIVAEQYNKEIELFGYRFDIPSRFYDEKKQALFSIYNNRRKIATSLNNRFPWLYLNLEKLRRKKIDFHNYDHLKYDHEERGKS